MERFSHEYTHCKGEGCPHDDCALRLAYAEALYLKIKNPKVVDRLCEDDSQYVRVVISPKDPYQK